MLRLRKISRVLIPVFLVLICFYITNETINQHYHKLSSGIILSHSHPYHENNDAGVPFKNHNHSSGEFIVLQLISTTLFWFCILIFLLAPILFVFKKHTFQIIILFRKRDLYFLRNYHAPPFHY